MKLTRHIVMSAIATLLTVGVAAAADARDGRIHRRDIRQEARIRQGVRRGDLTPREARRLRARERHIHRAERRAWADGRMTPRERRHIDRMHNRQNRRIHRLRHNGRTV